MNMTNRSKFLTATCLATAIFASAAAPAAARTPTFEVTVASSRVISTTHNSATIRMRIRVGFVNCRAGIAFQSTLYFPRSSRVGVYLVSNNTLRVRRGRPVALDIRRTGRVTHEFIFPRIKCQPSILTSPAVLSKTYTRIIRLRNLRPRQTYYLSPCLIRQGRRLSSSAGTRCASVVKVSTGTNWQAPDLKFAGILVPNRCRPGRTPIRVRLKNSGLGPVTRPFEVWFSYRRLETNRVLPFETRKITVRSRIGAGKTATLFVNIPARGSGRYTTRIRIDPQARLATLGENSANNSHQGAIFQLRTDCLGQGAAGQYDLAVSNIRFANNTLCKGALTFALSNRRLTRVPLLRINTTIQIWIDGRLRANQGVWYHNRLKSRRAVTLRYSPRVVPTNRRSTVRVRISLVRGAASRDTNAGNDSTERIFQCDPTRT